jgi:hypothetical protein
VPLESRATMGRQGPIPYLWVVRALSSACVMAARRDPFCPFRHNSHR